jgi:diadenylate cyclase
MTMLTPLWNLLTSLDAWTLTKFGVQFVILVGIIYYIYSRFIRQSHADRLLRGMFVILLLLMALWGLAWLLDFWLLMLVFGSSIQMMIIGMIVIFQPELRRLLLYLGQAEWFGMQLSAKEAPDRKVEHVIQELVEAARFLSKSKTGALIVLESPNSSGGSGAYLESGTRVEARLSTELLLTLFHTNAPLHDGAVIIDAENRVAAAGVLLPLTEDPNLSWRYGTRHRAAIGLTEVSDSRCIVVSEETGSISFVQNGNLEKLVNSEELKKRLEQFFHISAEAGTVGEGRRKALISQRISGLLGQHGGAAGRLQQIFRKLPDKVMLRPSEEKPPAEEPTRPLTEGYVKSRLSKAMKRTSDRQ